MFCSRYVVSPLRGSLCFVRTSTCRSGETHCSATTLIGCRLPIAPAGIVVVDRVPFALSPSTVCWPRSSVTTPPPAIPSVNAFVPGAPGRGGGGGGGGGASVPD